METQEAKYWLQQNEGRLSRQLALFSATKAARARGFQEDLKPVAAALSGMILLLRLRSG